MFDLLSNGSRRGRMGTRMEMMRARWRTRWRKRGIRFWCVNPDDCGDELKEQGTVAESGLGVVSWWG